MILPRYEDCEEDFLKAMAVRFHFSDKTELVFVQRLRDANSDLNDKRLADVLQRELVEGTRSEGANPATILRDRWIDPICPKLAEAGCDFNGATRARWRIAKQWLREVVFPEWAREQGLAAPPLLTPAQLWEQLKDKATPTEKMGPVLAKPAKPVETLEMWEPPPSQSQYQKCVPLGSQIRFEVNLESGGYLLLLEKGTSGNLWCLCPSFLAPQPHQPAGVAILPQEKSPQKLFTISGTAGKEEIVALIAPESPPLDWLPQATQPPLQLKKEHLNDLLAYLNCRPDCQALYTEYTVTP